jgi:uncharacterized protein (DUF58 family)
MAFADSFPGFRLRLTRWGGLFLLAMLVLGFAAVNTGNNALMALLGLALSSYVISGTWSREVLGSVRIRAIFPSEIFAERLAVVEVQLTNASRLFPAYGLVLRDSVGRQLLVEALLPRGVTRRRSVEVEYPKRGWNEAGPWSLEVLLPLGFFLKSKQLLRGRRVLVFPRLLPRSAVTPREGGGARKSETLDDRGREGDVVQLRDYRDGDDRRQMHWKQTARQQRPIVVDRQRRAEAPVLFVLDPRVSDPTSAAIRERFEHLVSEVATGVVMRLDRGEAVGLVVGREVVPAVRHATRAARLLRPLAEVEPLALNDPAPMVAGSVSAELYRVDEHR